MHMHVFCVGTQTQVLGHWPIQGPTSSSPRPKAAMPSSVTLACRQSWLGAHRADLGHNCHDHHHHHSNHHHHRRRCRRCLHHHRDGMGGVLILLRRGVVDLIIVIVIARYYTITTISGTMILMQFSRRPFTRLLHARRACLAPCMQWLNSGEPTNMVRSISQFVIGQNGTETENWHRHVVSEVLEPILCFCHSVKVQYGTAGLVKSRSSLSQDEITAQPTRKLPWL